MIERRLPNKQCAHRWEFWNRFLDRPLFRCKDCEGFVWGFRWKAWGKP
jgi:hypothetical protein